MRSVALFGLALLTATSAFAANPVLTLQNDSLASGSSNAALAASITTGEGYAARFKVEASATPVRLHKLQAMFLDDPSFPGAECGAFSLRVFEDTGANAPDPDGAAIYDSMNDGEVTFDIPATSGTLQEIDLMTGGFSPIWISSAGLRVELHAESNMCLMVGTGNMHFPVMGVDADGVSNYDLNFLFGFEKVDTTWVPTWYDTMTVGGTACRETSYSAPSSRPPAARPTAPARRAAATAARARAAVAPKATTASRASAARPTAAPRCAAPTAAAARAARAAPTRCATPMAIANASPTAPARNAAKTAAAACAERAATGALASRALVRPAAAACQTARARSAAPTDAGACAERVAPASPAPSRTGLRVVG